MFCLFPRQFELQSAKHQEWKKVSDGFTLISPENSTSFQVELSGKDTVYFTVQTNDGKVIAAALPRDPNTSIIVKGDGTICDAQPGQTWVDSSGYFHISEMRKREEDEKKKEEEEKEAMKA